MSSRSSTRNEHVSRGRPVTARICPYCHEIQASYRVQANHIRSCFSRGSNLQQEQQDIEMINEDEIFQDEYLPNPTDDGMEVDDSDFVADTLANGKILYTKCL
jgi:hypothetical protein